MKIRIQDSGFRIQARQAGESARPLLVSTQHSALNTQHSKGFTLIEMIVVIVISGIIAGMVAMFIRAPVQGYVDSARRAEMSDIADTALRRIARDLRTAVPNSVRMPTPAGSTYLEFLPTRDGGRYRAANDGAGGCGATGNELSFDVADTCFEIIGTAMEFIAGDAIVIGSTQSDGSLPYQLPTSATGVRRMIAPAGVGAAQTVVRIVSTQPFPASSELEGRRFEVVPANAPVTYACIDPGGGACTTGADGNGTCQLLRISGYGFNPIQALPATAGAPVLAQNISACNFVYNTFNWRNSMVEARLTITRGNPTGAPENVNLYHVIHINNIP